ncbi:MAG: alpha-L-fucosidase, partial [Planctomycetota bacterium]
MNDYYSASRRSYVWVVVFWAVGLLLVGLAGCSRDLAVKPESQQISQDYLRASAEDMQWWREARFGMFIHWGPASLTGKEISWSRDGERRGWKHDHGKITPQEIYDNLYKQFNPVEFDARKWVALAKASGMRYLVFTSKHHDGFSMYDSSLTDYKLTNSPFKRDVIAELAEACHEADLPLGFYYSPLDWYHPDYKTDNHDSYIKFMRGQLGELCSNYGKLGIIWFDGGCGTASEWGSEKLFKTIRLLQPDIIINNRGGLPGDYDTPEQKVGTFQTDRPWESCITIGTQWAWKPKDNIKTLKQCIDTLVGCAGGDGNLLFNVGPMPDGRIEPQQVKRLKEMGDWLKKYGQSIYGTRGGPFKPCTWGVSTCQGNTIYLHILDWDLLNETVSLPVMEQKIISTSLLGGGPLDLKQGERGYEVMVPVSDRREIDTIIRLHLDGPAAEIKPLNLPSGSLAVDKKATASNIYKQNSSYGPHLAVDDDDTTRWYTDAEVTDAWLDVDLGRGTTFNRAFIHATYSPVKEFELQYKDGEQWKTITRGKSIGRNRLKFDAVTARLVRLKIVAARRRISIYEFQLFN